MKVSSLIPWRRTKSSTSSKDVEGQSAKASYARLWSGQNFSLFLDSGGCLLIFIVNLILTTWSLTQPHGENDKGVRRIIREGSCSEIRIINMIVHLIINVLSSVLLAASNYGMQCLSAPTRADIDKAHFQGKWMDIGIPGVRNLTRISRKRSILWLVLIFHPHSYNSVVFSSLMAVDYTVWGVTDVHPNRSSIFSFALDEIDYAETNPYDIMTYPGLLSPPPQNYTKILKDWWGLGRQGRLDNLTNLECIDKYSTAFQTSHSTLIVVLEETKYSAFIEAPFTQVVVDMPFGNYTGDSMWSWMCSDNSIDTGTCRSRLPAIKQNISNWAPFGDTPVKYCLAKPVSSRCRLNFSPPLMAPVLVTNLIKAAVLLYVVLQPRDERLYVLGDAIESFLTTPDTFSNDSCLVSASDIKKKGKQDWRGPRKWAPVKRRWGTAISYRRWIASGLLYSFAHAVAIFFFVWGIRNLNSAKDFKTLWDLGFGKVTDAAMVMSSRAFFIFNNSRIIVSTLLANIPQFVFSGLYFQYNAIFTSMLAAQEWSSYGKTRKGLRVSSDPREEQRSTHFLHLPYRWGTSLILLSILIHWMLSQSIFVVAVEKRDDLSGMLFSSCGYSPMAILGALIASLVMVAAVAIVSCFGLPAGIPVVGSRSLAIAAAYHHPSGNSQPQDGLLPVKWGVRSFEDEREGGLDHCGFSSEYVEDPKEGIEYS